MPLDDQQQQGANAAQAGAGDGAAAAAASAAASTPAPVSGTQGAAGATGAAVSQQQPASQDVGNQQAAQQQTQQQAQLSGLMDLARAAGMQVDRFTDERQLADALLGGYAQAQRMAPYADKYYQNASQFERWQAEQERQAQQQQAQQQQAQKSLWDTRPEFDPRWLQLVEEDPMTKTLRPKAGAPRDVVDRVNKYTSWVHDWNNALTHDPQKALGPIIQSAVQEMIQSQMGLFQEQATARDIVRENESRLYNRNQDGTFQLDGQGRRQLSSFGRLYHEFVQKAGTLGITNIAAQHEYATSMAEAREARSGSNGQAATGQTNQQAQRQAFVNNAAGHQPNRNGAVPNNGTGQATVDQSKQGMSLKEALAVAYKERGITDKDFN